MHNERATKQSCGVGLVAREPGLCESQLLPNSIGTEESADKPYHSTRLSMFDRITTRTTRASLRALFGGGCLLVIAVGAASATTIQLGATKDATVYQNNPNNGGGGNPGLFVGTNSQPSPRRALIEFDLSKIPSNATITDVQLRLVIGQIAGSGGGAGSGGVSHPTIDLHELLVNWGEANTGASTNVGVSGAGQGNPALTGDATWNARFFDASSPLLSAPALMADVQGRLGSPSTNFGWMLIIANETAAQTFRAFYSKDYNPNPAPPDLASLFPELIVRYQAPEPSALVLFATGVVPLVLLRRPDRRRN